MSLVGEPEFKLEAFDRTSPLEAIIASIKHNGGARIKQFLSAADIASAEQSVRPHLDAASYARPDDQTKRLGRLPEYAPEMTRKILEDELYLAVMDRFLSKTFHSWLEDKQVTVTEVPIVAMSSIFEVGPGMHVQDLHRDDSIWFNRMEGIRPEDYEFGRDVSISFFVAGTKTTEANGATRFVPGSHLTKHDSPPEAHKAVVAELDAGDAFFMLSSCYHGAGQNSTVDEKRLVYALFMQNAHLRQASYTAHPRALMLMFFRRRTSPCTWTTTSSGPIRSIASAAWASMLRFPTWAGSTTLLLWRVSLDRRGLTRDRFRVIIRLRASRTSAPAALMS